MLYQGPLAEAKVGGSIWPSADDLFQGRGETAVLSVSVRLLADAGNEVSGAAVEVSIVVSSYEDRRPSARRLAR